jgi:hypothetical protein
MVNSLGNVLAQMTNVMEASLWLGLTGAIAGAASKTEPGRSTGG